MGKFTDLPADIMLEIFTRLPAELVLDCKSVSKTWRTVLQHPSLSQMHSNRLLLSNLDSTADSGKFISFILNIPDLSEPYTKQLYYLEYDDEVSSHRLRKLNLNPPFELLYRVIGSCNGLVCVIGLPNHHTLDSSTSAFICNPITRECITLPELDRVVYHNRVDCMLYGFGYVSSTNEYKVVRLYTFWEEGDFAQVEVYTLGSGKGWRDAGMINVGSSSIGSQHGVFVNGFLYWNLSYGKTMVFDLADEVVVGYSEFRYSSLWIGVLGGYLCGRDGKSSVIWLLKKKEDESFIWSKEFSLINIGLYNTPLALTSSGAVLCYSDTKLHLHDLKSSSPKVLKDFGRRIYEAIPHMNTFVSLKAFGEENTGIC